MRRLFAFLTLVQVLGLGTQPQHAKQTRRTFGVGGAAAAAASLVAAGVSPAAAAAPAGAVDPQVYELAVHIGALERSRPYEVDGTSMKAIRPSAAVRSLADSGTVWIGERRDATDDASLASGILAAMALAKSATAPGDASPIAVGLEAVRADYQDVLDAFVRGELAPASTSATAVLRDALDWDRHWPYPIERYGKVFELCRALGFPLVALGANARDIATVEASGLGGLDRDAWARLSLPEGPEALARFAGTAAYERYASEILAPDYERFSAGTGAPFMERAPDGGKITRAPEANFRNSRLVWDASAAARAADWVASGPRRADATLVALVGPERVAFGCGAAALCAQRLPNRPTRTVLLNPAETERARGRISAGATTSLGLELAFEVSEARDQAVAYNQMQSKSPTRPALALADYVWFSPAPAGRDNFI